MSKKVGMISLGCPKNQVDGEIMLSKLADNGFEITNDVDGADVVIVNTCGFIEDAKKEAIENILDMVELKKEGVIRKIVVTGCLAERYRDEVLSEIPEVDAVVGIGSNSDICEVCEKVCGGEENIKTFGEKTCLPLDGKRMLTTPSYYAYIKIGEGCSNNCTYCAIPSIRGKYRSRTPESILEEAKTLVDGGVKELIVVAQDTTRYGEDLFGKCALPALLTSLSKIEGLEWIRVLYLYPERLSDEIIDTFANNDKIVNYMDIPIQLFKYIVLLLHYDFAAFFPDLLIHLVGEFRCRSSLLLRVGKATEPVKLHFLDKFRKLGELLLRFARKACYQGSTKHHIGYFLSYFRYECRKLLF